MTGRFWLTILLLATPAVPAIGAEIKLRKRAHDPYGAPRPAPDQKHVPPRSSIYVELGFDQTGVGDEVLPESVAIELRPEGGAVVPVLGPGRKFADGYTGRFVPVAAGAGFLGEKRPSMLAVYADPSRPLRPATAYTIRVTARSRDGGELPAREGTWTFTTEDEPGPRPVEFTLSLADPAVRWRGGFFTGFCNVAFATSRRYRLPTYDLMAEVRKAAPRAWSFQRDFWLTGTDHPPQVFPVYLPNIVRERETRHVTAIEDHADGHLLHVEDFFGHAQYGIPDNRPVSADYHPGDEVLVADASHSSRAKVVRADDERRTVLVSGLEAPKGGWKLAYAAPPPTKEDPGAPGLFALGGCHLLKFRPHGTPVYYWGRLDAEWDLTVKKYGRRVLPNFADAPGDVSLDGRPWNTAKDYAELHEVVRTIAGHVVDRYGEAALAFPWSIFNEPDLGPLFWRSDWDELQKFYDYATDAVLRAFEDRGYDSGKVFIGGLELGGLFGTHLKIREFLAHCSPRSKPERGARPLNAAFADMRLDGKRSRRVEGLCRAHGGRGAPCDFVSVHAYNAARVMAEKLAKAKEVALEIDPEFYANLQVNSHESTPGWLPPPDPAYRDSYLGNGYYPTWCADVARRQLARAAADPRFAAGESILTVWPWPNPGFGGGNDTTRAFQVEEDGKRRTVTVAMPILRFLGLLARMGPEYHVLPERVVGGHVVSGFASRDGDTVRLLLYSHNPVDTESRSDAEFDVSVSLAGLPGPRLAATEYRFDRDHNSYYRLAKRELARRPTPQGDAVKQLLRPPGVYPAEVVKQVAEQSVLRPTGSASYDVGGGGDATVKVRVAANGASIVVLERSGAKR